MKRKKSQLLIFIVLALLGGSCSKVVTTSVPSNPNPVEQVSSPTPSPVSFNTPDRSRYEAQKGGFYGLYYLASKDHSDERKLIISDDGEAIPPKANDPDEATLPGFYLSHEYRLDFAEIEIIGKSIFFRTRESSGSYVEFRGVFGEEIDPNFSDDIPIPFIKGTLRAFKNGKVVKSESVRFGHAVIA